MTARGHTSRHGSRETILVIEDEPRSQRLLRGNLEPLGYHVVIHDKAAGVTNIIDEHNPSLILLDVRLPDGSGFDVCQRIRSESTLPVIMLSAFNRTEDKLHGFSLGADDYVAKPYDPAELSARIDAVLRRVRGEPTKPPALFCLGALTIDFEQRLVWLDGHEVALSRTEYRLLECLALNAGRVLVADALLTKVWGHEYIGDYASLHLYVSRLRRKLREDASNAQYIVTKPGVGYTMPGADKVGTRAER